MKNLIPFGRCCVAQLRYRAETWKNVSTGFDAEERLATALSSKEEIRQQLTLDRDAWRNRTFVLEQELKETKAKSCSEENGTIVVRHTWLDGGKGLIVCKTFDEVVNALKMTRKF